MSSSASPLFDATEPAEVLAALRHGRGELLDALERGLSEGLSGSPSGTALYAHAVHELATWLVTTAWSDAGDEARARFADFAAPPKREQLVLFVVLLESEAVAAPFTAWPTPARRGDAAALHLTDAVRRFIDKPPVNRSFTHYYVSWSHGEREAALFAHRVRSQLVHGYEGGLERVARVFDLSKSDLGRLFGVARQSIDRWLVDGVPADRQEKLASMLALADLLERKLKAGRVPGVARRSADAYGGLTMLKMIAADRHDELLASVRDSFDWARAA